MPTQKYALTRNEEKRLVVTWDVGWTNIRIELDGNPIGTIESRKELQDGKTFTLPDKTKLEVKLQNSLLASGLELTRDGVPVPDSIKDSNTGLRNSYIVAYVVAIYNIIIGFLFVVLKFDTAIFPNYGYVTFVLGAAYLVLAQRITKKSLPALIVFLVIFSFETLLEAATNYSFFVYFRGLLIYYMFQGFGAIKKLKAEETEKMQKISE